MLREYRLRLKLKEKSNPVKVQLLSLQELPEPLSKQEFLDICRSEGLPVLEKKDYSICSKEPFSDIQYGIKSHQNQKQWNNTMTNLFGAYLTMYDLFKQWHF